MAAPRAGLDVIRFSQATKQDTVVFNTLQRTVADVLAQLADEPAEQRKKRAQSIHRPKPKHPPGRLPAKGSSSAASIAACDTYIQAAGRRLDGLAPPSVVVPKRIARK